MKSSYEIHRWESDSKPETQELVRRMRDEGYSVFEWSDSPGSIYPVHSHNDDQSHWLISGSIRFEVDGFGTAVLNAGDRDFMPRGTRHSAAVVGNEPAVYLIGSKV